MLHANNKKTLNIIDVIVMTVAANFGIRWIAVAAGIGPSSFFLWMFGALIFFIPIAIISAQMSRAYPSEGGLYEWTRQAMGEKHAFTVAWFYWVNAVFYYPAILIFLSTNFAYAIGNPELAHSTTYIATISLIGFWIIIGVSLLGLKASKYLVDLGSLVGLIIPMVLLIIFAAIAWFKWGSATDFHLEAFVPGGKIMANLSSLSIIMFAMAGVEVVATFANSVEHPKRDLYYGLLIGSICIFVLYILGTLAMNVLVEPKELQKAAGLMQTFDIIGQKFDIPWLPRIMAGGLTLVEVAAVIVWLLAPVTMFFKCTPRGILPNWMHKTNQDGTPTNAILFQGLFTSVVITLTSFLPSVNVMYEALVLMATILYFIPYLFMAVAYARSLDALKVNKFFGYLLTIGVLVSVLLGIFMCFMPSENLKTIRDIIFYEAELILGPAFLWGIGWLLYRFRKIS